MNLPHPRFTKSGFTLIEILVVIAIIAILSITLFASFSKQRIKATDSAMKSDLNRLKTAFEEYYNDHNCYPPEDWFQQNADITGSELRPYLNKIPFDSQKRSYILETDPSGCTWFKLYATLNDPNDPASVALRSPFGSTLGNYGVSSSNTVVSIYYDPTSSPTPSTTPTPSSTPGTYYCQTAGPGNGIAGNCSSIPAGQTCSPSYTDPNCGSNRCATTVSTCY